MKNIFKIKYLLFIFIAIVLMEIVLIAHFFQIIPTHKFLGAILPDVLVDLTNQNREEINLNTLRKNPLLEEAANLKAKDMASKGYFSHTSPEGIDPWHWFDLVGYDYVYAGENLAVNFFDSHDIDRAWMNSPKHMRNIINDNFREIGIGMATGEYQGRESIFVVQLFGTRRNPTVSLNQTEETIESPEEVIPQEPVDVLGEETEIIEEEIIEEVEETKENNLVVKEEVREDVVEIKEESFAYLLGEEPIVYNNNDYDIEENEAAGAYFSLMGRIASSPKRTITFVLLSLLFILGFASILKIFFKRKINFPVLVAEELLVLIIIFSTLLFNDYVLTLLGQVS